MALVYIDADHGLMVLPSVQHAVRFILIQILLKGVKVVLWRLQ